MFLFSNRIYLSKKENNVKDDLMWTSDLVKTSEKEPGKSLENLVDSIRVKKELNKINEHSLDEKRVDEEVSIGEKKLTSKHNDSPDSITERQADDEDLRNSEFYDLGTIPLFVKNVYPKQKTRSEQNEKYYKDHKEVLQSGDVVSASKEKNTIILIPSKSANMVEDMYIKKTDPKENDDEAVAFVDTELKEVMAPTNKKNGKKKTD